MLLFEKKNKELYVSWWEGREFPPHLHHHYELLICTEGRLKASCRGVTRELLPGDVMAAFSNDIHSYEETEGGRGVMLLVQPSFLPMVCLRTEGRRYENFLCTGDPEMISLARACLEEYRGDRDSLVLQGLLDILLGRLLKQLAFRREHAEAPEIFSDIMGYVLNNYTQPLSLKGLSEQFHISPSRISRLFTDRIACGFLTYLHELRVEHAKYLLRDTDYPVARVWESSGFSDQKTFNRVFLSMTGRTPREFRSFIRR